MPNLRINTNSLPGKVNENRFYVPGVTLYSDCPECGLTCEKDMDGDHYLSYPPVNKEFEYGFYCQNEDCQHEWKEKVILRVTLEIPKQDTNCGNLDTADFQAQLINELIEVVEKYKSKDQ